MAFGEKKRGGGLLDGLDLDEESPKRPGPGRKPSPIEGLDLDEEAGDVAGEVIAERAIAALKAGDAAKLSRALKDHYEHCKSGDGGEEPMPESGPGLGFGGPGSEY